LVNDHIFTESLVMRKLINSFRRDDDGAAMVEYGLLVGLIALGVAAAATTLGGNISTLFTNIGTYLAGLAVP
jgi:pilus assembly protein Flp/PilA